MPKLDNIEALGLKTMLYFFQNQLIIIRPYDSSDYRFRYVQNIYEYFFITFIY